MPVILATQEAEISKPWFNINPSKKQDSISKMLNTKDRIGVAQVVEQVEHL
jgi:hypothetical protein